MTSAKFGPDWHCVTAASGGRAGQSWQHISRIICNMDQPTPTTRVDIRSTTDPETPHALPTKEIVKVLFSCNKCKLKDPRFGCILEKHRDDFETNCGVIVPTNNTQDETKRCRHLMYYHMAIVCLVPMEDFHRTQLPLCVVRAIQARYPDPRGSHRDTEAMVIFYRRAEKLYMEIKARPYPWPYTLH